MASWPCKHCSEVNANRNARQACVAYAYCFYKTANNAQVCKCSASLPLPSLAALVPLGCSCCTNGLAAKQRCAMFLSSKQLIQQQHQLSPSLGLGLDYLRRFKALYEVDYAIIIGICGLIYSIYVWVDRKGQGGNTTPISWCLSKWIVIIHSVTAHAAYASYIDCLHVWECVNLCVCVLANTSEI